LLLIGRSRRVSSNSWRGCLHRRPVTRVLAKNPAPDEILGRAVLRSAFSEGIARTANLTVELAMKGSVSYAQAITGFGLCPKASVAERPFALPERSCASSDGRVLPPGEIGEIYSRIAANPDFTYHNKPEKRAAVEWRRRSASELDCSTNVMS
jgi:hypothetical protein